ncbi:MAG TPA: cytochrome P450 [Deltaproteobacteria bacterium]|nr:cytochrome P450 [Deltaproteobacteria bacterium]
MEPTNGLELIDPKAYAEAGAPHDVWTRLRRESPVHPCSPPGFEPFWAITRHADICEISKRPDRFVNAPGIFLMSDEQKQLRASGEGISAMRTIIEMDPPEHRRYRKVASPRFTPRAIDALEEVVRASARQLVDKLAGETGEGECDFAIDVAAAHPLRVLSTILGVPRDLEPKILELTNQLFGADDPDLRREGDDPQKVAMELGLELFQLFTEIIEDRRANPRDDLATVLANAKIDGEPMGPMETVGYYLITFTAGHDTTKNALVGGMRAFLDHPDQLERLKRDPGLSKSAVEEIVRWTTPVNYMKRTAARDVEIRGRKIREGENLVLFYASANRDEDVFEDPFAFRIDRKPNPHLGFGIGEHFCIGSHLARKSQLALWQELSSRLEWVESAGPPEHIHSSFVVGLKRLPIRYRLLPAG